MASPYTYTMNHWLIHLKVLSVFLFLSVLCFPFSLYDVMSLFARPCFSHHISPYYVSSCISFFCIILSKFNYLFFFIDLPNTTMWSHSSYNMNWSRMKGIFYSGNMIHILKESTEHTWIVYWSIMTEMYWLVVQDVD